MRSFLTITALMRCCCKCKQHRPLKGGKVARIGGKFTCQGCVADRSKVATSEHDAAGPTTHRCVGIT